MWFFVLVIIYVIFQVFKSATGETSRTRNSRSSSDQTRRKSSPSTKSKIEFRNLPPQLPAPDDVEIKDLRDAFTGAPLDRRLGLYKCTRCSVYYHSSSFEVLVEENNECCVSCKTASLCPIKGTSIGTTVRGRNTNPDVVTLANYRNFVGSVVTFEGRVPRVNVSRSGLSYFPSQKCGL